MTLLLRCEEDAVAGFAVDIEMIAFALLLVRRIFRRWRLLLFLLSCALSCSFSECSLLERDRTAFSDIVVNLMAYCLRSTSG